MTDDKLEVGLNEFASVVAIIDIAVSRGAFKGEEMLSIGTVREKFKELVELIKQEQIENEADGHEHMGHHHPAGTIHEDPADAPLPDQAELPLEENKK